MNPRRVVVTKQELARTFDLHVNTVERWIDHGCPHVRLRPGLVLLYFEEVTRWLVAQPPGDHHPLTLLGAKAYLARTAEDLAAIERELAALVAMNVVDTACVPEIRRALRALAHELRRRSP